MLPTAARPLIGNRSEGAAGAPARGRTATGLALVAVAVVTAAAWRDLFEIPLVGEDYAIFERLGDGGAAYPHVFRPLSGAFLRAMWSVFGAGSQAPYRAVEIALHAANGMLVFALALGLLRRRGPALVAGLCFAVGAVSVDTLAWVANTRPVSACAMLIAANGLVRLGRSRLAPPWIALGLAAQALANEEVFGTAALAAAWLAWSASRASGPARRRRFAGCAAVLAAAVLHYLVFGRVPDAASDLMTRGIRSAPWNALERSSDVMAGLGFAFPGAAWMPFVLVLPAVAAKRFEPAAFALLAWLAAFVPFALDAPVEYRSYASAAPAALLVACAVDGVIRLLGGRRAVELVAAGAASLLVVWGAAAPRAAQLERWHAATREVAAVVDLIRARAWTPSGEPPALVNVETSSAAAAGYWLELDDVSRVATLDFFDAVGAYVAPSNAPPRPWIGRRVDGSYGEIDPATYFDGRTEVPELALVGAFHPAADVGEARRLLADAAIDHARTAVVETDVAALGPRTAEGTVVELEPLVGDLVQGWGRMSVGVEAAGPTVLALRSSFQYWHRMRFSPDQMIFSDVSYVRALRLAARIDGGPAIDAFPLDAFGFGVPVPAGTHRVDLEWRRATPEEQR